MRVDHILGGELPVPMVELDPSMELDPPGLPIRAKLPAVGKPGHILAGLGINLDEPLQHGVMLDVVVSCPIDPWPYVIKVWRDEAHHQAVDLGGARWRCGRWRLGDGKHQEQ
jgi:hypothetical protein